MRRLGCFAVALGLAAAPAAAEFAKVADEREFTRLVVGKTLSHLFFQLQISPEGGISGHGIRREVRGEWRWQDGYFCRDLFWGDKALGYNCQEVEVNGQRIRFTADRGAGDSAVFRLRPR